MRPPGRCSTRQVRLLRSERPSTGGPTTQPILNHQSTLSDVRSRRTTRSTLGPAPGRTAITAREENHVVAIGAGLAVVFLIPRRSCLPRYCSTAGAALQSSVFSNPHVSACCLDGCLCLACGVLRPGIAYLDLTQEALLVNSDEHLDRTPVPTSSFRRAPGPRRFDALRAMRDFLRDPLDYLLRLQRYGDVVRTGAGTHVFHTIYSPVGLRQTFIDQPQRYTKRGVIDDLVPVLGDGLLISEGTTWKQRRSELSPCMARRALDDLVPTFDHAVQDALTRWQVEQDIDASRETEYLALLVVGRALFDVCLDKRASDISVAVEQVSRLALRRSRSFVKVPLSIPTPPNRAYLRAIDVLQRHADEIIAEAARRSPFMARAHAATEPDTTALRNEVITFLLAGHETTANTLAWAIGHLAQDQVLQNCAREESRQVLAQGSLTVNAINSFELINAIISETMRLYPPGWMLLRRAEETGEVMGYTVPRHSFVVAPVYALHRDPRCWPDPERFDPRRFIHASSTQHDPLMYLPFGIGPRRCIGEGFARLEMCIALARMLDSFRILAVGQLPEPQPLTTLRPSEPIRVMIAPI